METAETEKQGEGTQRGANPPYSPLFAESPARDGREWDNRCARCGADTEHQECEYCGGEGVAGHDCGEDCCCCLDPEENVRCDVCGGRGGWLRCGNTSKWCNEHPLPGRENVERGKIEWYPIS